MSATPSVRERLAALQNCRLADLDQREEPIGGVLREAARALLDALPENLVTELPEIRVLDDLLVIADEVALEAPAASGPAARDPAPSKAAVTRFEVIDHRDGAPDVGRLLVTYGDMTVSISPQDGGRTLKIFLDGTAQVGAAPGETK